MYRNKRCLSFDSEEQILFVKVDFWSQELNICLTLQKIEISYGTTSLSIIIPFITIYISSIS